MNKLNIGDYVLATKWSDGNSQEQWCVGFYAGITAPHYNPPRYDVVDENGVQFRSNGFRRVKKISKARGEWILKNMAQIEESRKSLWYFARCKMT